jgi:uncharacterized repeat protein (TIGR01451 family)
LFSPAGAAVLTFDAHSQQQLTLGETGTYIIQVYAHNLVSLGSYSLGLECLVPTSPVDGNIDCGSISRSITASAQVDQIIFTGQATDMVTLNFTSAGFPSGVTARATVFLPTGVQLSSVNAPSAPELILPETGTYIIQVRASNLVSPGSYNLSRSGSAVCPDLTLAKRHADNFVRGAEAQYTLTVTNLGSGPTSGGVSVTDILPSGLTATSMNGAGWACQVAQLVCSRSDVLAAGASYPTITLTVQVEASAPPVLTNVGQVAGGGDLSPANNMAADRTIIARDR